MKRKGKKHLHNQEVNNSAPCEFAQIFSAHDSVIYRVCAFMLVQHSVESYNILLCVTSERDCNASGEVRVHTESCAALIASPLA